jgi:hypothetical protein
VLVGRSFSFSKARQLYNASVQRRRQTYSKSTYPDIGRKVERRRTTTILPLNVRAHSPMRLTFCELRSQFLVDSKISLLSIKFCIPGKVRLEEYVTVFNSPERMPSDLQPVNTWSPNSYFPDNLQPVKISSRVLLCSDEREARRKLGEEVEMVKHEWARACALANEAQALRNELLACRQKLEAKKNFGVGLFQKICAMRPCLWAHGFLLLSS